MTSQGSNNASDHDSDGFSANHALLRLMAARIPEWLPGVEAWTHLHMWRRSTIKGRLSAS
jgi:hypothetical protein